MDYRLQISTSTSFAGTLVADINIGNNFYCDMADHQDIQLSVGMQYYWRVVDSNGVVSPVQGIQIGGDASPYRFEISDNAFVSKVLDVSVGDVEYNLPIPLARSASYQWRVSGAGNTTSASSAFMTRAALSMPLIAQAVILDKRIIRVTWGQVGAATQYRIVYKTHNGGLYDGTGLARLMTPQAPEGSFLVPVSSLQDVQNPGLDLISLADAGTEYWFGVSALDEDGESDVTETIVGVTLPEIDPVYGTAAAVVDGKLTVTWLPSVDAAGYRIYYKTHSGGEYDGYGLRLSENGPIISGHIDIQAVSLADPLAPSVVFYGGVSDVYWFAVSPIDGGGVVGAMAEMVSGYQLELMAPASVHAGYANGYVISWTRNTADALANGCVVYYKTDPQSPIYNGTGLRLNSFDGPVAPSPINIDSLNVSSLVLYGGTPGAPYWFAVSTKDAQGNTSELVEARGNVTGYPGQVPAAISRSPANVRVTYNQVTKTTNITWEPIE